MTRARAATRAAICACALLLVHGVARATIANDVSYETGALPSGGTYVVHRDLTAPTIAVNLWYRAPAAGYDESTPGIARLALTAIAASAPAHGTSLSELVTRVGGSLSISVYPDIAMIGVSVPTWEEGPLLRALTSTFFSPQITQAGYKSAVRDCAIAAAESHFDSDRILQDALFAHLFSSGPAHYAPVPAAVQEFSRISVPQAESFAKRAFRRSNVMLTIAGGVGANWLTSVAPAQSAGAGIAGGAADAPLDSTLANSPVDVTQTAQVGGIGVAWLGPPISDMRAATAMDFIADYLFDANHGTVAASVRRQHSGAYLNGQFITLHDPGVMLVTAAGADSDVLRGAINDGVKSLAQPLDGAAFNAARAAFMYAILSQTQTPASQAENFGWYAAEGNLPYAPGSASSAYFQAARSLDPGFVASVARRYLQRAAVVNLITAVHGTTT